MATKTRIVTGQCNAGWHEGTKPVTRDGKPIQVCRLWEECPCECHSRITAMFESAGQPRELIDNPDYMVKPPDFYMPVFGVDYGVPVTVTVMASPGTMAARVNDTPSGRTQPGGLEAQVLEVCTEFSIDPSSCPDAYCTPKFVSGEIARLHGIKDPSTGAVQAAWERWEAMGFAEIARKPVRFVGFTAQGKIEGLDLMRAKWKRAKK